MAFGPFPAWQPGMIVNEERANSAALVGRTIFKVTRDSNQSLAATGSGNPDVASNALGWETVSLDDLGGWSASSPTRYTCQLQAWYKINPKVGFNGNSTGSARSIGIYVNGTLMPAGHFRISASFGSGAITVDGDLELLLNVGDYVQIAAGQDTTSGGLPAALNTATGGVRPCLEITFARHA
ncbi:hypothetical protein [Streptomyces sp. NPDC057877]|uniref:hypothetical protein n=1 Tax=Streptomyces sp. NPDC057877 TaxID=3346269 RepID=UPI0036BACC93